MSFTGSVATGARIMQAVAPTSPGSTNWVAIVLADATSNGAKAISDSRVINTGQVRNCAEWCTSSAGRRRVYRPARRTDATRFGDPMAGLQRGHGPLINHRPGSTKVAAMVVKARQEPRCLPVGPWRISRPGLPLHRADGLSPRHGDQGNEIRPGAADSGGDSLDEVAFANDSDYGSPLQLHP